MAPPLRMAVHGSDALAKVRTMASHYANIVYAMLLGLLLVSVTWLTYTDMPEPTDVSYGLYGLEVVLKELPLTNAPHDDFCENPFDPCFDAQFHAGSIDKGFLYAAGDGDNTKPSQHSSSASATQTLPMSDAIAIPTTLKTSKRHGATSGGDPPEEPPEEPTDITQCDGSSGATLPIASLRVSHECEKVVLAVIRAVDGEPGSISIEHAGKDVLQYLSLAGRNSTSELLLADAALLLAGTPRPGAAELD